MLLSTFSNLRQYFFDSSIIQIIKILRKCQSIYMKLATYIIKQVKRVHLTKVLNFRFLYVF